MPDCPTCEKSLSSEQGMRQHHTKVHDEALPNRTCESCGTEFYDPQSRRKNCSDCYSETGNRNGNWKGARAIAACRLCGGEFEYYPSNKDGVYCTACVENGEGLLPENPSEKTERITIPCRNCGAGVSRLPSGSNTQSYGVFCDSDCYGSWLSSNIVGEDHHQWEGGEISYGQGWWRIRRRALRRDDYTCQRCGDTKADIGQNPDVHHLVPVREFDSPEAAHSLSNVVTLCRPCHQLVESGAVPTPST